MLTKKTTCPLCGQVKFPRGIPQHAEPKTGLTCPRLSPGA